MLCPVTCLDVRLTQVCSVTTIYKQLSTDLELYTENFNVCRFRVRNAVRISLPDFGVKKHHHEIILRFWFSRGAQ